MECFAGSFLLCGSAVPRLPRVALRQKYGKIALTEQEVNTDLQDLDYTVRVHFAFQYKCLQIAGEDDQLHSNEFMIIRSEKTGGFYLPSNTTKVYPVERNLCNQEVS